MIRFRLITKKEEEKAKEYHSYATFEKENTPTRL